MGFQGAQLQRGYQKQMSVVWLLHKSPPYFFWLTMQGVGRDEIVIHTAAGKCMPSLSAA